jgi:hypothetical protein
MRIDFLPATQREDRSDIEMEDFDLSENGDKQAEEVVRRRQQPTQRELLHGRRPYSYILTKNRASKATTGSRSIRTDRTRYDGSSSTKQAYTPRREYARPPSYQPPTTPPRPTENHYMEIAKTLANTHCCKSNCLAADAARTQTTGSHLHTLAGMTYTRRRSFFSESIRASYSPRDRLQYKFAGRRVCQMAYGKTHAMSPNTVLKRTTAALLDQGSEHGRTGSTHNSIDYLTAVAWFTEYINLHADDMPDTDKKELPATMTISSIYAAFVKATSVLPMGVETRDSEGAQVLSRSTSSTSSTSTSSSGSLALRVSSITVIDLFCSITVIDLFCSITVIDGIVCLCITVIELFS